MALLDQAWQLRAYGVQYGIGLLTVSEFDATPSDLHAIGSIALGMFGASAYYLADYGQGMLVVTVKSETTLRILLGRRRAFGGLLNGVLESFKKKLYSEQ